MPNRIRSTHENSPLKFGRISEGLYKYKPNLKNGNILLKTINDNKSFYTDRQTAHAKRARESMHTSGCPSVSDLKCIMKINGIKECPITIADRIHPEKIFWPDLASHKEKTVKQTPMPVVADAIEIPMNSSQYKKKWIYALTHSSTAVCHSWQKYLE